MAQPVRQVALRAPGFQGLNTELSPINGDPEFALVADNVVVDQIGRLVSRKAFSDYRQLTDYGTIELLPVEDDWSQWYGNEHTLWVDADNNFVPNGSGAVRFYSTTEDGYWDGDLSNYPSLTLTAVSNLDLPSNQLVDPKFIIRFPAVFITLRDAPTFPREDEPFAFLKARQNGEVIAELPIPRTAGGGFRDDDWSVVVPDPDSSVVFTLEILPILREFDPEANVIWQARDYSIDVAEADLANRVFNEIIKLGRQVSDYDAVQAQHDQRPAMIYRYAEGYEYPSDTRCISSGMGKRRAKRNGLPELSGEVSYGVSLLEGDTLIDTVLPAGWGGVNWSGGGQRSGLLTGEFVSFKDDLFLFAKDNPFLRLDADAVWTDVGAEYTSLDGTTGRIDGDIAISAYGRLWVTGVNGDYHQIYYSALLDESQWVDLTDLDGDTGNDAGVIDVREYWPIDGDSIVGIHAHNGYLLVFGRNSILLYANADSGNPASEQGIFLEDAISDVGLVRRDAICNIGTDVLFVDDSGLRSIGRVVREKSSPITEPSMNIRRELQEVIKQEVLESPAYSAIRLKYIPSESLAVLLFASLRVAYVFHLNMPSKTGGMKVTRWTDCFWNDCMELKVGQQDAVFLAGKPSKGLLKYKDYLEGESDGLPDAYVMRYESMALALGESPMQTTIPKSINYVCMGEFVPGQANALWGFSDRFVDSREFQIEVAGGAQYDVDEFASDAYYLDGGPYYKGYKINTTGSGELFRVGFEVKVQGGRYALQEIDINSAVGRLTA